GTIQLDFSMPQRFGLVYTDKDNTEKTPVMIHRAVLGSFERFLGILIEHYAGDLPLWLAPEQARVLPISDKSNQYALQVQARLQQDDIRCGIDLSDEKITAKIARAYNDRVPVMLVVGPKEAGSGMVNLRIHGQTPQTLMDLDRCVGLLSKGIADKTATLTVS
ncbi:MAG: His/Gly/Thr/Pro-type tRNA ligase C-terminal domain-containing protein, partial [Sedimentisphaerales bacterium]|nr:His/Gly/Thr/Pro-type tRNA ligase C-terminal domain-containing protein [Sedimentisphaerales bacterium]